MAAVFGSSALPGLVSFLSSLLPSLFGIPIVQLAWFQISQRCMQPHVVVLVDQFPDCPRGLQIIVSVVVVAVLPHRSVESLDDSV